MSNGTVLLLVVAVAYFLPTIVAFARGHHQRGAIMQTNVFLGWTFLGWVIALIWSATHTGSEMFEPPKGYYKPAHRPIAELEQCAQSEPQPTPRNPLQRTQLGQAFEQYRS